MNDPFAFNSFVPQANAFLPDIRDRRWLERRKQWYQNPERYKEHLKEGSDEDW